MLESFNLGEFKYKKLTEAEQQKRGILGRLVGVIADTNNATRNGRKYGLDLWKKVFDDPLMKEKITNRCVFSELGHPTDREEIDMSKVCACLAEQPKLGADGKLYGVFDILDLPNGRILKTLCDYGTNIGVSSRGSGDIMDNDEVDPDTYYCECFDIVAVPAVKDARLQYMTESLHNNKSLNQALLESYNKADDNDKKVMKETLDELNISVDEKEIPWSVDEEEANLEDTLNEAENIETEDVTDEDVVEEETDTKDSEAEESEDEVNYEFGTVKEFIDGLKDFDKDLNIEFSPIKIDDKEYTISNVAFDDSEDGKVIVNIDYTQETEDNIEDEVEETEDEVEEPVEVETADEEVSDESEDETDEAEDNGVEEVIESLKEMVRQKDLLENEIKSLKETKTVSDTEVKALTEELNKYKAAFARTSEIAATAKGYKAKISQLNEQLDQKNCEINNLKKENSNKLNEGIEKGAKQIAQLKEQLKAKDDALYEAEEKLHEQVNSYRKTLNERTEVAKKYKAISEATVTKYISFRAQMLGVKPAEIKNKLNERYTLDDVDKICDEILTEGYTGNKLPFGNTPVRAKFNEGTSTKQNDYGVDKDLLELAGLL